MIHVLPGVFLRYEPRASGVPLVIDVSRSGREYPPEFRSPASFTDVHDNVSMYVEEIWGQAPSVGAQMIYAMFPNTFIDVNRGPLDIDPQLVDGDWPELRPTHFSERGLGLLKKVTRYGEPMHEWKFAKWEVVERIQRYHEPYHAELAAMISQARARFGKVWHFTCHCMSAVGAPTHPDKGQPRADVCLGNLDGTSSSEDFIGFVRACFEKLGYSVSVNTPYQGGEINRRYGDPRNGVETILVELNKKLFMDTKTFRKAEGFHRLRRDVTTIMGMVADFTRDKLKLA